MRRALLAVAAALVATSAGAQAPRSVANLNAGWSYLENRARSAAEVDTATAWRPVQLPHTWNAFDATDLEPGYRRDASWYRRTLQLPAANGARQVLYFEGATNVADVWVNGRRAGGHVGGFLGFEVDITDFARAGANDIRVRVDNSFDPDLPPSNKADFAIFGGITRDVWLKTLPAVHLGNVQIRTPEVSRAQARTALRVEVQNPTAATGAYTLETTVRDARGAVALRGSVPVALRGDSTQTVAMELPRLRSPRLWSPADPTLYRVSVTLKRGAATVDQADERIGYRWYRFEPNGPFYLNGERLLLRGTHRHEEHAGLGAALPNEQHRADMAQIRGMGANFVRLAHYPQDPEVYRAADSLGILLWDEVPWNRGGVGGEPFKVNTRRLLREMIRQNFNHPSIILWSMGNEVGDVPDEGRADPEAINAFIGELNTIAHQMDPDRLTSMRKHNEGAHLVDVYSPSIWAGWYSGVYTNYEKAINDARARFPRLVHMEYGADGHVGRHTENPITGAGVLAEGWEEAVGQVQVNNIAANGDWSESYQTDLLDWHLMVSERQDWFAGNAQWVFKDFATPLRPENPIPYMNQKGLVDRAGVPKDAYYVFRSYWTDNSDFAYIISHTWTERSGPAGRTRNVRVYSNCARVELTLNGASQGVKIRNRNDFPAQGLRWDVNFAEGDNRLAARCPAAPNVGDTLTVRYSHAQAGAPDRLVLTSRPLANGNLLVEAVMVDTAGRRLLNFSERVYFAHDGGGELLRHYGTPTRSQVIEAANGRAAIELVPPKRGERAVMEARTQDFKGIHLVIEGTR